VTIEKKWKCTIEKLPNGWLRPHWDYTAECVDEVELEKLFKLAQECVLVSREYLNDKGAFNLAGELSAVDIILSELMRLIVTREITKFYCDKEVSNGS